MSDLVLHQFLLVGSGLCCFSCLFLKLHSVITIKKWILN